MGREGFDGRNFMLSDTVVCLDYFVAFCISLQPRQPGSSQILIESNWGCVGWRVCILRHEDWVMEALWKWYLQIQCPFRLLPLSYFLAQITGCVRGGWWQLSPSYSEATELPVWQRGLRLRGCLDWRWCRPRREQSWLPWEAAAAPQLQPFLAIKRIMLTGVDILIVLTGQNMSLLIEIHT